MQVAPLRVGAEITGIALDQPISAVDAAKLQSLMSEHQLLVFRGQDITPQDQVRVLDIFGSVLDEKGDGTRYQYVSGEKTSIKPGRLLFHSDNHFTQVPLEMLSLYGEKVDAAATPTLFVDNVAGYRRLGADLREKLNEAQVTNRSFFFLGMSDQAARELPAELEGGPVSHHPAIWHHPDTGVPFVYLTELHAYRLDGMSEEESNATLDAVFSTLYADDAVYRHEWADGDLVVWNNRTVQHARGELSASEDDEPVPRSIRRVSTGTATFSEQFEFKPEVIARMREFYQQSVLNG